MIKFQRKFWPNSFKLIEELVLLVFLGLILHATILPRFLAKEFMILMGPIILGAYAIKKAGDAKEVKYGGFKAKDPDTMEEARAAGEARVVSARGAVVIPDRSIVSKR